MSGTLSGNPTGLRTVTAFFDTQAHADVAKQDLIAAGVADSDITLVGSNSDHFTVAQDHRQGFWESLTNWFIPEDDRRVYAEGLRRGGFAISVRCEGLLYKKAVDVLDRDGAVDLDERSASWLEEGWNPAEPGLDSTPYRPADSSTAGFGGSYAGEDGLGAELAPTAATRDGLARETEAQNPDVRERIGAGTASFTAPGATGGPQSYADPSNPLDDAAADAVTGRRPQDPVARRDLDSSRGRVRSYVVEGNVNR